MPNAASEIGLVTIVPKHSLSKMERCVGQITDEAEVGARASAVARLSLTGCESTTTILSGTRAWVHTFERAYMHENCPKILIDFPFLVTSLTIWRVME